MTFFGDPKSAEDLLAFLGTPLEGDGPAPYSLKFLHANQTPSGMEPHARELPNCGSPTFECSCADCNNASYCKTVLEIEKHNLIVSTGDVQEGRGWELLQRCVAML